jgi:two-component system sensor histidine kinase BarA
MKKLPPDQKLAPDQKLEPKQKLPRVLYVEDNEDNWRVTELRVSRSYDLVHARTDREACAILRQPGKLYAILMDIELGGSLLNGIQLTQLIRGKLPQRLIPDYARDVPRSAVPVLFVTAYGDVYPRSELLAAGADDVLAKPVDFTRLNLTLARLYINRVLDRGQS